MCGLLSANIISSNVSALCKEVSHVFEIIGLTQIVSSIIFIKILL